MEGPIFLAWTVLLWAGLAATLLVSWLAAAARWYGLARLQPGPLLGCLLLPRAPAALSGTLGRLGHLVLGSAVFPLIYSIAFRALGSADAANGVLLGAVHGTLAAAALGVIGRRGRCMRNGRAPATGHFGRRLGVATPLAVILGHMAYGALLGYVYVVPGA